MPLSARRAKGGLAVVALVTIGLAGCAEPTVLRVVDGREVRGRFVSDYAYALYGRAAYEEAMRGAMSDAGRPVPATSVKRSALAALEAAASDDEESAHLWTAVGALRCRPPDADLDGAHAAFDRASGIDPEYAPLYREIAQCRITAATAASDPELARTRRAEALANAQHAVRLDPDDVAAASIAASSLVSAGRAGEASRLLRALTIRRPGSTEAWLALITFARATHDEALLERAARKARELSPRLAPELEAEIRALAPLAEIDDALRRDDLAAARRLARRAHLPLAEVAARAAALGRAASARAEAAVVLAADPADITARIALAVAADLAGDPAALAEAMSAIPAPPAALTAPSPLAGLLFAELLFRRVDEGAARAWLAALPAAAAAPPDDALLVAVSARVRARVADPAPQAVTR
jgi:tetratricopeptide (TPR) repeat protein